MNGWVTLGSEVLVRAGSLNGQDIWWGPGLPTRKVANAFMIHHIETCIHTKKVEGEKGKKKRGNIQGTLEVRVQDTMVVP